MTTNRTGKKSSGARPRTNSATTARAADGQRAVLPWIAAAVPSSAVDSALDAVAEADRWSTGQGHSLANGQLETLTALALEPAELPAQDDPLAYVLLAAELPLAMLPGAEDPRVATSLSIKATHAWRASLAELNDDHGLPHARHWEARLPLLACWTRCLLRAEAHHIALADDVSRLDYVQVVRQAMRFARADGTPVLSSPALAKPIVELLRTAVALSRDAETESLARQCGIIASPPARGGKKIVARRTPKVKRTADGEPDRTLAPSNDSETSGVAILRADWSAKSPRLAVLFGGETLILEMESAGVQLFAGEAEPELTVAGERLAPAGPWEHTCWIAESGGDFLEIERPFANGWIVQRQLMILRQGAAMFLADAAIGPATAAIDYRLALPLAADIAFHPYPSTHEGELHRAGKPLARVLPISLPEWRAGPNRGSLTANSGQLALAQRATADRLYSACFIDLDRRRIAKPATWRHLTIGEQLQIQPANVAVGYRVQAGRDQWLFYRSLAAVGNRTVLGVNLCTEFLAAQFGKDGKAKTIVEVE